MRRRISLRVSVVVWLSTLCECGLLAAWKLWGVAGAGNLLAAWVVIGGLCGAALLLGPPSGVFLPDECVFGYRFARLFDLGMVVAFFWLGHSLLGVMWALAVVGNFADSRRSAALRRGGMYG